MYIGNTVQGKSEKLSYKGEERRYKPQSEWDIVENTHDAIVSYDTWHKAQIIRSTRSTPYKQDMKIRCSRECVNVCIVVLHSINILIIIHQCLNVLLNTLKREYVPDVS